MGAVGNIPAVVTLRRPGTRRARTKAPLCACVFLGTSGREGERAAPRQRPVGGTSHRLRGRKCCASVSRRRSNSSIIANGWRLCCTDSRRFERAARLGVAEKVRERRQRQEPIRHSVEITGCVTLADVFYRAIRRLPPRRQTGQRRALQKKRVKKITETMPGRLRLKTKADVLRRELRDKWPVVGSCFVSRVYNGEQAA